MTSRLAHTTKLSNRKTPRLIIFHEFGHDVTIYVSTKRNVIHAKTHLFNYEMGGLNDLVGVTLLSTYTSIMYSTEQRTDASIHP